MKMIELKINEAVGEINAQGEVNIFMDVLQEYASIELYHAINFEKGNDIQTLQENAPSFFVKNKHGYMEREQIGVYMYVTTLDAKGRPHPTFITTVMEVTMEVKMLLTEPISNLSDISKHNIQCEFPFTQQEILDTISKWLKQKKYEFVHEIA